MTLTKYEHACLVLEDEGKRLIIDPGQFTVSLPALDNVVAIVITHIHSDHIDEEKVRNIRAANPDVQILSVEQVAKAFADLPVTTVNPGEGIEVSPFRLEFFGGDHAVIHPSRPQDQNIGVLVNDRLYYPGDSFALPHREIKVLAAPAAAPWLKISEAMDFVASVQSDIAFPTHDAILSENGQKIHDSMIAMMAEQAGVQYQRLKIGETLEV